MWGLESPFLWSIVFFSDSFFDDFFFFLVCIVIMCCSLSLKKCRLNLRSQRKIASSVSLLQKVFAFASGRYLDWSTLKQIYCLKFWTTQVMNILVVNTYEGQVSVSPLLWGYKPCRGLRKMLGISPIMVLVFDFCLLGSARLFKLKFRFVLIGQHPKGNSGFCSLSWLGSQFLFSFNQIIPYCLINFSF